MTEQAPPAEASTEAGTRKMAGRCLCRAVSYRCGPLLYPPTLCHCESCRRAAGAHAVGWLTVRRTDVAWTGTAPKAFESSPGVQRTFCARCGTPLSYQSDKRPMEVDLTIGSLERAELATPADHIWMEDAPPWDRPGDGLPQFPRGRKAP